MSSQPVFFDASGARRVWVKRLGLLGATAFTVAMTLFVLSLLAIPFVGATSGGAVARVAKLLPSLPKRRDERERAIFARGHDALLGEIGREKRAIKALPVTSSIVQTGSQAPIVAAFYAPWQQTGLASFRSQAAHLTHVIPAWLSLNAQGNGLDTSDFDFVQNSGNRAVIQIARRNHVAVCPLISNAHGTAFDATRVHRLLSSPRAQTQLIGALGNWLVANKFQGLNLDFENLQNADEARLPAFMGALGGSLHAAGLSFSTDLENSLTDAQMRERAVPCDFSVLMAYDQHADGDAPGPIAGFDWGADLVKRASKLADPQKLVLGVGNYAYDWTLDSHSAADALTYEEALFNAQDSADKGETPQHAVDFDPQSLNATYEYQDEKGKDHQVWMLDAASAYNQWQLADRAGLRGSALWLLGSEDPSVWSFFRRDATGFKVDDLNTVRFPYEVSFIGDGEILQVAQQAQTGTRQLELDPATQLVTDEQYQRFPSPIVIKRSGFSRKDLALTFDDGPDPQWTPQVLDILRQYHVKASFFVVGDNAEKYPDLVRRIYDEGHDIGNHTFTHPNIGLVSPRRAELELNATQSAIEGITGHSTRMFRPPYNADAEPQTAAEVSPVTQAAALGYLTVGEFIDPQDWNPVNVAPDGSQSARTAPEMIRDVMKGADTGKGNIILLHDAGGDRAKTLTVLRTVLPALEKRGFSFVPVSQLAGGRAAMMPAVAQGQLSKVRFDRTMFDVIFGAQWLLTLGFIAAIGLGIARVAFILPLAAIERKREQKLAFDPTFAPLVSVLIAGYNEEKTIEGTIRSVLGSDYPNFEIIVVDDGSKDQTSAVVQAAFGAEPRVRLMRQANGGKAAALNYALTVARGEITVGFDADTQVAPDAIGLLVRHFADAKVGAVAGNVKVGNRLNTLTRWQAIEYITSQNLDRRAYGLVNAITVVPGAIGAWRRAAVMAVGGYVTDTLAEDMDLTWRLRREGWIIRNETRALAFTEAPDALSALSKQRFRWAYGTLQCLHKHRRAMGRHGFFGRLALPTIAVFQFVLQVLAPLVDVQLVFAAGATILSWYLNGTGHGQWTPDPQTAFFLEKVGFFYALFFAIELAGAYVAVRTDKEDKSLLWWLFWQRFVYRQMLYAVIWKSLWTAIVGQRAGWNKLARRGTVAVPVSGTKM